MDKTLNFFQPKSIAIIGASRNKQKLGHQVLENLLVSEYPGKIYPINPKAKNIHGLKSYNSVLSVPGKIDLAVFIVPKDFTEQILKEVGQKKIPAAIIITAGFGELGQEGRKKEAKLLKIAKKYQTKIIGPNCLGVIDTHTPLNVSFAQNKPFKKNLAVVSQSGAMCTAILDWAMKNNIGFSKFVSLGNKIDIDETDIFKILKKDKNTKVCLGYFEGIQKGNKFIKEALSLSKQKPLIAIKAGESKAGAKAASSHTGALTSDTEAINAAFRKAGIVRVNNIEELFDFSEVFSALSCPKNNKVAVLTNAGGPGVLTTDFIEKSTLELAKLNPTTKKSLKKVLPSEASVNNPIDLVGDAPAKRYRDALAVLSRDKNISMVLILLTPQSSTEIEKTAQEIALFKKKINKPIVACFLGGVLIDKGVKILEKSGVPNFEFPERAVKALSELYNWQHYISVKKVLAKKQTRDKRIENIFNKVKKENRYNLNDKETKDVMKALGIKTARSILVKNSKEAQKAVKSLGYPAVLKIVSADILHKTEYGLVKTGINSEKEAQKAYSEIIKNAQKLEINYVGVMAYEMVKEGVEFIIGAKRDKTFGPILMFGLGGTYVELFKDTQHTVAPITQEEAKEMIFGIKGYEIITGFRGKEGVNQQELKNLLVKIGDLMFDFPEISELDINPVKADAKYAKALDIKIVLE